MISDTHGTPPAGSTFTFGDIARDPDLMVKTFLRRLENSPFSVFAPSLPFAAFGGTAFRAKRTLAGFIPNPFINPKSYPLSQTWMSPNTTLSIYYVVVVPKGRAEWLVYTDDFVEESKAFGPNTEGH
jgi:hypothetical protein